MHGRRWSVASATVCLCSKRKTAWAINPKFGTHILYGSCSACTGPKIKGQGHMVMKTVTVARLLVAAVAVVLLLLARDCMSVSSLFLWRQNRCIINTHTHTHTTVLRRFGFCPGQPRWAGTRRNIHSLTPIVIIKYLYLLPPSSTIHGMVSRCIINAVNKPIRAQPAIWQPREMLEMTWHATSTSSLEQEKQSRKNRGSAAWHRTSLADIATRSMPTESYQQTACDICHMNRFSTQNRIDLHHRTKVIISNWVESTVSNGLLMNVDSKLSYMPPLTGFLFRFNFTQFLGCRTTKQLQVHNH